MKLLTLWHDDACTACARPLPVGMTALWDASSRSARCAACAAPDVGLVAAAVPRPRAGESARREYARRAERHDRARAEMSWFRRMLSDGTPPSRTRVWAQGAAGEEVVGQVLDALSPEHLVVLHDRRLRDDRGRLGQANIDHVVIASTGVWVVDTKTHQGHLEVRGGERLYIRGRDQGALVPGLLKQVASVRRELGNAGLTVPVQGALCFVGTELPWRRRSVGDVPLVSPRGLRKLLLRAGAVTAAEQGAAAALLDARFPGR